tara:strand:+ start:461 stop:604 length:144 start_codon:yes stop_codon:yes gene_type:complete
LPQTSQQEKVLNGRRRIILYLNENRAGNWSYKEKIKGEKKYRREKLR